MPVFFLDADLPVPVHSQSKPLFTKIVNLRVLEIVATAGSSNYQPVAVGICLAESKRHVSHNVVAQTRFVTTGDKSIDANWRVCKKFIAAIP
jgi:hypothetical protein